MYSADVNYFGTREIINSHRIGDLFHLFRILLWRELHVQMQLSNGSEMPGCDVTCLYYFGSDMYSGRSIGSYMNNKAPSLSTDLFTKQARSQKKLMTEAMSIEDL